MKTTKASSSRQSAKILAGSIAALLAVQSAQAATIYWDGTGTGWDLVGSWDTAVDGTGGDPGAIPGAADVANFSINTVNSAQTVNLNGDQSALGLVFLGTNTATTLLQGGGTDRTLTLETSGITVNSGAGAVTIGSATAGQNVALTLAGAQTWTNNSTANALTVENAINTGANLLTLTTTTGNITVNGAISGSAGLRFIGAAPAGGGNQAILTLSGANNYTGETFLGGGNGQQYSILRAGSSTAFGAASATLRLAPKTNQERLVVQLFGNNITLAGLNQTGGNDGGPAAEPSLPTSFGGFLTNGAASAATFTLDNTIDSSFMGAIRDGGTGSLAITKKGTGALTLRTGNTFHSYTGQLTIEEGTFAVDGVNNISTEGVLGNNALAVIMGGSGGKTGILRYFNGGDASTTKTFSLATGGTGNFQVDDGTTTNRTLTISGAISGGGALAKSGADTLTLSATNAFTGGTTVSGGILKLDYTSTLSKLSDTGVLTFAGGTIDLTAGSHTEVVASTTLNSGASGVTRTSGTGILRMGAITRNAGGFVNFGAASIASTSTANDATGILGSWATIGGLNWATNTGTDDGGAVGNSLIGTYAGYVNINALGSTIVDGSTTNVRINAAGTGGNIALSAATTSVNTLLQGFTTAATVDTTGKTLQTSAIMLGAGMEALTIGVAPGSGTLTAATVGGDLLLINNRTDRDLTIKASVQNNTSASSLTKVGAGNLVLAGANNFSGGLNLNAGTLTFASPGSLGSGTLVISNATTINSFLNGTLTSNAPVTINGDFTFSGTSSLNLGTSAVSLGTEAGSARMITASGNALSILTFGGVISNGTTASSLTKAGGGTIALTGANTYTGTTTISNGTVNASNIVVSGGSSSLGNASDAVVLGDSGNRGTLNYTGGAANYTRGLTINNGSGTLNHSGSGFLTVSGGAIAIAQNANFTVGGPVQNISISSVISGVNSSLTKTGLDSVTLSAANTYSGATTVNGGTLTVTGSLNGTTGTALSIGGGGTFNVSEASGVSQGMGALTFAGGSGTIQSTNNGGNSFLSFTGTLPASTIGNALNFVTTNGTNGVDNRITVAGQALGFVNRGTFYGGSDYAYMHSLGGYVRGIDYGVDPNSALNAGGASAASTTNLKVTGNLTAQADGTQFTTILLSGTPNITLATGATVNAVNTLNTGLGLLKTGGGTSTISGGAIQMPNSSGTNGDDSSATLVIRVDGATDNLIINSRLQRRTTGNAANAFSKFGAGNLTLNGSNTLSGAWTIDGGGTLTATSQNNPATAGGSQTINVGSNSAGNTLTLSGNAKMHTAASGTGTLNVGTGAYGSNVVNVSVPGHVGSMTWHASSTFLGTNSDNNSFTISNGAYYRSPNGFTFASSTGSSNSVTITGANTTVRVDANNGSTIAFDGGANNSLTVSSGAALLPRRINVGANGGFNNSALITGVGTNLTLDGTQAGMQIGANTGSNNSLRVESGAFMSTAGAGQNTRNIAIGMTTGSNNNYLLVTGLGTFLNARHVQPYTIGGKADNNVATDSFASGNHLDVHGGGTVFMNAGTSLYVMGVNSAVNLGNGVGLSTLTSGATSLFSAGIFLLNGDGRLNINSGRLIAGAAGALVSGSGEVALNGPAFIATTQSNSAISTVISGPGSLIKEGTGTLVLSAANTYSGGTVVTNGTLALDYATTVVSKLADAGVLTLSGGTLNLRNGGSAHVEEVASTSLGAGRSGVTQTTSTSTLRMNTITSGAGMVNFGAANIADTDNLNDASGGGGILGTWATVGGTDWAVNSTNLADGAITAYANASYTDVANAGAIADGPTTNVRVIAGGPGNTTLPAAALTTVNTLLQTDATNPVTVAFATNTDVLATSGIMISSAASVQALTIGTVVGEGDLQTVTAGANLVLNNNQSVPVLTINSRIVANGASGLATAGAVTLNGVNTYTGPTGVGGTLTIGGAGQLNSGNYAGAISIAAGGTLVMNSSASQTLSGAISGDGAFTQSGAGTTTLSGPNTYTGVTTVNAGILAAGNSAAFGGAATAALVFGASSTGTVQLNGNNITLVGLNTNLTVGTPIIESGSAVAGTDTLTVTAFRDTAGNLINSTYAGVIRNHDGSGTRVLALQKNGTGGLTLSGNNSYSGGTTINGGTLTLGHQNAAGTGLLTMASTTTYLQSSTFNGNTSAGALPNAINLPGGEVIFNLASATGNNVWLNQAVSGGGAIRLLGDGTQRTLTLSGAKAFAGGIIQVGTTNYPTVAIDDVGSLGTGTFRAQITGGDFNQGLLNSIADLSAGAGVTNAFDIHLGSRLVVGHSSATNHLKLSGVISGGGNLIKTGLATLTLSGGNTYSGTTTVSTGTLAAAHATALGATEANTSVSSGATLDVRATVAEPISVTGTGVGGAGALINGDNATGTVTGTVTLTGATSIGGAGTGTLNINGTVAAGANTLTTLGTGVTTFGVSSTLTSLATLLVTDGTTNVNSALGTAGNAAVTVSDAVGSPATKLRFGSVSQTLSSLTIGAGATVVFTSGVASGSFSGGGDGKAPGFSAGAVVPEPGTIGLLLVGALGMLGRRRRA